jgi:acetyltransferase-like isoleucine patch superfamily enzyme
MRTAVKAVLNAVAMFLALPSLLYYAMVRPIIGADRALEDVSQLTAFIPGLLGQYMRRAVMRVLLSECSAEAVIGFGAILSSTQARLGNRVYIGPYCTIGAATIGDDVLVAAGVHIPSGPRTHGTADLGTPIREQEGDLRRVTIGRGTWIGNAAVIMADVGADCIIGAGAVVVKPIPAASVAVGVPARVVRARGDAPARA